MQQPGLADFAAAYAEHRAVEGRTCSREELFALPYLRSGPLERQWAIRARTFSAFVRRVLAPMAAAAGQPLTVLDLGSGNGWLSHRVALAGHSAIALDIREDSVDGLGAAEPLVADMPDRIARVVASFDAIPLDDASVDLAVFNASLHYATDLGRVLGEARRVTRADGRIAILDSPFYRHEAQGLAMVAEKQRQAAEVFGDRAERLTALPFIEFLTRARLIAARPDIAWRRDRVLYPLGYELRPLRAALRGERTPSRFDLWVGARP